MPESVGFLQISLMAMVSHCSQHSQQYKSQICSPELPEPHWLSGKCSGLQPRFESTPEQEFFFPGFPFPVKINLNFFADSAPLHMHVE